MKSLTWECKLGEVKAGRLITLEAIVGLVKKEIPRFLANLEFV